MNAPSVSASELIGGSPPEKKQRPPWPPGVPLVETFPGSKMFRHPVDKAFIKPEAAIALGAPSPVAPPPQPAPAPELQPQPEIKPEPEQNGPAPDFSDLPESEEEPAAGNGPQQEQGPTEAELLTAYEQMGKMFWDSIIRLMCALFGDFWAPANADERKMVIDALTAWMKSVAFEAFTPLQNLYMAIALYAMPRMPKTFQQIITWWKSRKKKDGPRPRAREEKPKGDENIIDIEEVGRGPWI